MSSYQNDKVAVYSSISFRTDLRFYCLILEHKFS